VVGGGYTGLSAALHLREAGYDVALLEAQRVGWGASGRNGGQVGTGMRQDQDWLEKAAGRERARAFWDLGLEAVALVKDLIARHAIDCDLRPRRDPCRAQAAHAPEYEAYAEKLARDYGYDRIDWLDRDGDRHRPGHRRLSRRRPRPGRGASAPAELRARPRPRRRGRRRAHLRAQPGHAADRHPRRHGDRRGAGPPRRARLQRLRRLRAAVAARVMPINNFIVATEPLGAAAPAR
jgi:gamma-glutamylputrescine oxidase